MRVSVGLAVGVVCGFGAAGVGCASRCPPPPQAPESSASASSAPGELPRAGAQPLVVRIDAAGVITVDEQPVALDALGDAVTRARPDRSARSTTIQADARVSHGAVLAVLEELRRVGITGVMFSVVGAEPASAPPAATGSAAPAAAGSATVTPVAQAPAPEEPASLPEVKVENIGLHIGGGPNDDATKEPFRRAIAQQYDAFRRCYTLVDEPAKGGTFGVDLRVGRAGGKADVLQPRTGMKGKGFSECMVAAFAQVDFEKPGKPVMFSYSLRFTIGR
ncbi:MAG: biopolymer transporter ExbD [Sorangiineae bacterium]|nr:biopolymer transporter ExbD [Polyangiaceae bacterium]MEB2323762.1 biopolymer transporter ExbD [Sorangiineae bacterium]